MKKNGQKIIFAVVCVVIIVGLFWYTAAKKGNSAENNRLANGFGGFQQQYI